MANAQVVYTEPKGPVGSAVADTMFDINKERRGLDLQKELLGLGHEHRLKEQEAKNQFDMLMNQAQQAHEFAKIKLAEDTLTGQRQQVADYAQGLVGGNIQAGAPVPPGMAEPGPGGEFGTRQPKKIPPHAAPAALEMLKQAGEQEFQRQQQARGVELPYTMGATTEQDHAAAENTARVLDEAGFPEMASHLRSIPPGSISRDRLNQITEKYIENLTNNRTKLESIGVLEEGRNRRSADTLTNARTIQEMKLKATLGKEDVTRLRALEMGFHHKQTEIGGHIRTLEQQIATPGASNSLVIRARQMLQTLYKEKSDLDYQQADVLQQLQRAANMPTPAPPGPDARNMARDSALRKHMPGYDNATPQQRAEWYAKQTARKRLQIADQAEAEWAATQQSPGVAAPVTPPTPPAPPAPRGVEEPVVKPGGLMEWLKGAMPPRKPGLMKGGPSGQ